MCLRLASLIIPLSCINFLSFHSGPCPLFYLYHLHNSTLRKQFPYIPCIAPPGTLRLIFKIPLLTWFTNHIIHLSKAYKQVVVSVFTQLLNHHQNLIFEHFYHPKKKSHIHFSQPHSQSQSQATTNLLFVSVESYNSWSLVPGFFHLIWCFWGLFMLQHVLVLHSCLLPNNIPLYGSHFIYSLISWWTFGLFPLFWLLRIMFLCTSIYKIFYGHRFSVLLNIYLWVDLLVLF